MSKKKPPAQLGLGLAPVSQAASLRISSPNLLSGAGLGIGGPAASLLPPVEQEPGEFDGLEGLNDEERAAALVERALAIASNKQQREGQRQAVELANDTEYWFAVYFQTREQKEAFLRLAFMLGGPEDPDKYIDGQKLAKRLDIELPPRPAPYKVGKLDEKLKRLT